jgi:hypothetical protein
LTSELAPGAPGRVLRARSTAYSTRLGGAGSRRTSRCISRICAPVSTGLISAAYALVVVETIFISSSFDG